MKKKKHGSYNYRRDSSKYYWRDSKKESYRGYSHPPSALMKTPDFHNQYSYKLQ